MRIRHLIRLFPGGIANWFKDEADIDTLAKVFGLANREQSVYEVADGEEECLAAAAHKLADPGKSPDPVSVLRINRSDLAAFAIGIENQFGTTGVPQWDRRHRNLLANREQLLALVAFLAGRCYRGHDQVRRIEKQLIVRALKVICGSPSCHCPDHVKAIAQWCQSSDKTVRPNLSLDQIKREVAAVEFEDEAIRPGAERRSSGDPVRDWYDSLNALRGSYRESYLPAVAERFGLREPS